MGRLTGGRLSRIDEGGNILLFLKFRNPFRGGDISNRDLPYKAFCWNFGSYGMVGLDGPGKKREVYWTQAIWGRVAMGNAGYTIFKKNCRWVPVLRIGIDMRTRAICCFMPGFTFFLGLGPELGLLDRCAWFLQYQLDLGGKNRTGKLTSRARRGDIAIHLGMGEVKRHFNKNPKGKKSFMACGVEQISPVSLWGAGRLQYISFYGLLCRLGAQTRTKSVRISGGDKLVFYPFAEPSVFSSLRICV